MPRSGVAAAFDGEGSAPQRPPFFLTSSRVANLLEKQVLTSRLGSAPATMSSLPRDTDGQPRAQTVESGGGDDDSRARRSCAAH